MSKECDFYVDRGADFLATVNLVGLNQHPLDLSDCHFTCDASFIMHSDIHVKVECLQEHIGCGELTLFIPAHSTARMPKGGWDYTLDMTFQGQRRMRILTGHLNVVDGLNK